MKTLLRAGAVVADAWTRIVDDEALPAGPALMSLARWQREREAGTALGAHGVLLPNTLDVDDVWPQLANAALIALEWPKSVDGRAFSQARVLRDRHGFRGEIRATGEVTQDLLQAMQRCGVDAYELRADQDVAGCLRAFSDFDLAYQAASDSLPQVWRLRARA